MKWFILIINSTRKNECLYIMFFSLGLRGIIGKDKCKGSYAECESKRLF